MSILSSFRRITRSVPLSIVAILVGAAIITPSVSGAAAFLTKQKANKLFLGNTSVLTQTQSFSGGGTVQGGQMTVLCAPGFQATGGGANSPALVTGSGSTDLMILLESAPVSSGGRSVGWQVDVIAQSENPLAITAHAVCSK